MRPTRAAARRLARHLRITPGCLPLLLGLAPGGVFPAAAVTGGAVRSYRTVSPLPPARRAEAGWRCTFCGTFPGVAPAGRYPAPCLRGARTFLSPRNGGERPSSRLAPQDLGCCGASVKASSAFEEAGQANPETISAGFDRIGRRAPHPDPLPASGARERAVRPLAPRERGEGGARDSGRVRGMSTAGSWPRPPGASPRNPVGRRRGRRRSNPAVPPPDGSQGQASQGDAEQCEGYRRPGAADNRVA